MAQGLGTHIIDFGSGEQSAVTREITSVTDTPPNSQTAGWFRSTLPSSGNWSVVASGNGIILACMQNTTTSATSSDGGKTWTTRTLPIANQWFALEFGNGVFVLVSGTNNVVYTSSDGINWSNVTGAWVGGSRYLHFEPQNGYFYIFPATGGGFMYRSTNGTTWEALSVPASNPRAIAYGNGVYVAIPYHPQTVALYSYDGATWYSTPFPLTSGTKCNVAYGNGMFLVGEENSGNVSARSFDGINWHTIIRKTNVTCMDIRFSPVLGAFVLPAATNGVMVTSDGIEFQQNTDLIPTQFLFLSQSGKFCMVSFGSNVFAMSDTGVSTVSTVTRNIQTTNETIITSKPFAGENSVDFTVTGISGIQRGDSVQVWLMGDETLNNHNKLEHLVVPINFRVLSVEQGVGFTVRATSPYRLTGTFKIRYAWSSS